MKVGFVITAHCSEQYRPKGDFFVQRLVDSIKKHCNYNYTIYVIDNTSTKSLGIDLQNVNYTYIEDQTLEGITGAWNIGIYKAFSDGCEIVLNCNDDIWFENSINKLIEYIIQDDDINSIYSGLTNGVLSGSQLSNKALSGVQVKTGHDILNGFCFAMSKKHYQKYCFEDTKYFNRNNKYNGGDGKWGGQEGQFMENAEKGLTSKVVNECFINHDKLRGWKQLIQL